MNNPSLFLTLSPMRLELALASDGGYGFGLSLSDGTGGWRAITAADNSFVQGSTFDLRPSNVIDATDARIQLRGKRQYEYTVTISADPQLRWFKFEIEIDLPQPLSLSMRDGLEPQIMLDMGLLPPYERGDHVWFMTNVANPTKWNDDAYGNDMPATYLFDAYKRAEFMMFFDMTAMNWMSCRNTGRFLNCRCGYRRRYQPAPAAALGLYLDGFSGKTLPAGRARFVYYITAAPRERTPKDQEAVQWLLERCLPLLPPLSDWPSHATDWHDFAERCAQDLMTDHAWHTRADVSGEYLLNYVDAQSPAWQQAIEARGNEFDMDRPCLESAVWGAHPLGVLCRVESNDVFDRLLKRMLDFIDRMVAAGRTPLAKGTDAARGVWQHLYIVEQMFQIARLQANDAMLAKIRQEVDATIVPLTRKMQYLLPLSFDKQKLAKCGSGDAHAALGIYASFMLDLHDWTAEQTYLNEAQRALRVLYQLPINTVHQEVFMLAMGCHAAARLAAKDPDGDFIEIGRYLLAQALRMMHWFDDRTAGEQNPIHTLGFFQACATISYSALFENIETLARLAAACRILPPPEGLLRIFDHARKNNFYFFPQCLPGHDDAPLKYVPLENIGILEGPKPAQVGAEIYGAGWVFRAYLLWEALGRCADREIMVLNCDQFDERRQLESGQWDLTFMVLNPTLQAREAELVFPLAIEHHAVLVEAGTQHRLSNGRWKTHLAPGESRRINVRLAGAA